MEKPEGFEREFEQLVTKYQLERFELDLSVLRPLTRAVSGTYKAKCPSTGKSTLELRVDVDGLRPQQRISGDFFKQTSLVAFPVEANQLPYRIRKTQFAKDLSLQLATYSKYDSSFIIESVSKVTESGELVMTGSVHYYDEPGITNETIEVRIKRVNIFSDAADALVRFYKSGLLSRTFLCPKMSETFRKVTLEIDRYTATSFPKTVDPTLSPSPSGLPSEMTVKEVMRRSGIELIVNEDDVLTDPDSDDAGSNWDVGELHDLMEDNFDRHSNIQQWNLYGVVVPKFGEPNYDSGFYGVMFDWGGYQPGDTFLRQGFAIAEDAIKGRSEGTLYNTDAKKDRLILQTFVHELGHAFNLPHSWSRSAAPSSASKSFMNYPWGYTGGSGGESQFWSDFRWEFDDVELRWMRHGNRKDVIFGGVDWIGNNLSQFTEPEPQAVSQGVELQLSGAAVLDLAEPVRLEVTLKNNLDFTIEVPDRLDPEDGLLSFYIRTPRGEHIRYVPPVRRLLAPPELVELKPGEEIRDSVLLAYSAKGMHFQTPGEYLVTAYYGEGEGTPLVSQSLRLRVGAPYTKASDELAYQLFDASTAKFLYFGGTERNSAVVGQLQELVERYRTTHPGVVRQVCAALGKYFSRNFKYRDGQETKLCVRAARLDVAERYLREALTINAPSVNPSDYAKACKGLAEVLVQSGRAEEANQVLSEGLSRLGQRSARLRSDIAELGLGHQKSA